jgi:hypothetical protein
MLLTPLYFASGYMGNAYTSRVGKRRVNAPASAHGGGECLRHRADQEGLGEAIRGPRGNYALTFPSLLGVAVVARM